jgi:hypothetical protein
MADEADDLRILRKSAPAWHDNVNNHGPCMALLLLQSS